MTGWINSKALKPKEKQWVLVSNGRQVFIAEYFKYVDKFYLKDVEFKATHWMPLPKPPKMKKINPLHP
ncbi:hypothetical protein LCGC14_3099420 [marine sediment metagenome]|uniref:DUF551 domain-containing protein n=1 Tax=marine sediment metagenome TaxID=412755 RepID=A0A0F8W858_9ZZZZ